MTENLKRISVSIIGIPIVFGSIYYGGIYFFVVVTIIALLSQLEFYNIAKHKNVKINSTLGLISGFGVLYLYYISRLEYIFLLFIIITIIFLILEIFSNHSSPLITLSLSLFGIIYPTMLIGTLYPLRNMQDDSGGSGLNLVVALLAGVWLCDIAAYYIGRAIGKHKLLEGVSPNKTWEGSVAGFSASFTVIYILKQSGYLGSSFSTVDVMMLSLFTGAGGQFGDLFESLIKREAGIKDSGKFLPGHGGFLDRFDALIFAAPLTYIYFLYF